MRLDRDATRVAIYARVSTADQVKEGTSLDSQLDRARTEAATHGWVVVGEFVDAGLSGKNASRPSLDQVLRMVEDDEVDKVLITKLDRIARSLKNLLDLLALFIDHEVALVALDDAIDPSSPSGMAMIQMRGVFAELERALIVERTIDGVQRRLSEGCWIGGPPPYGFASVPNPDGPGKRLAVDQEEAATVLLAYDLLVNRARSTNETAAELNRLGSSPRRSAEWTGANLRRLLGSACGLSGDWVYNRAGRKGRDSTGEVHVAIPAILTRDQHDHLDARLAMTTTAPRKQRAYLLRSILTSPCDHRMQGIPGNGGTYYYRCPVIAPGDPRTCNCGRLRADIAEDDVWDQLTALLSNPDALRAIAGEVIDSRRTFASTERDALGELDRRIVEMERVFGEQAAALITEGISPTSVAATMRSADERLGVLRHQRDDMLRVRRKNLTSHGAVKRVHEVAADLGQALLGADFTTKRYLLEALDIQVRVVGWEPCDTCAGRGLLPAQRGPGEPRRLGNTGTVCPACLRAKRIANYTIEGSLPEMMAMALSEGVEVTRLPVGGGLIPFRIGDHAA